MVGVRGDLVRVHLRNSMTHNRMANTNTMANTMTNANTISNTMANANTMTVMTVTDSNTMSKSNAMSDPSKELRSGRCGSCRHQEDKVGGNLKLESQFF